jgi:hypothetical protein
VNAIVGIHLAKAIAGSAGATQRVQYHFFSLKLAPRQDRKNPKQWVPECAYLGGVNRMPHQFLSALPPTLASMLQGLRCRFQLYAETTLKS